MIKAKCGIIIILMLVCFALIPVGTCYDFGAWVYRETLTFDYDGDFPFQLNFNVSWVTGMQTDFDDLRFATLGNSLLGAYLQNKVDGDYCNVWVNVSSTSFFMYYGNDEIENYWDIDSVFVDVIDSVVLALPMDEGSGDTVYDYSGNKLNGSLHSGVS